MNHVLKCNLKARAAGEELDSAPAIRVAVPVGCFVALLQYGSEQRGLKYQTLQLRLIEASKPWKNHFCMKFYKATWG